ncbi:MAG: hypothetical protein D6793_06320, partial [Thermoflexia bacterium]
PTDHIAFTETGDNPYARAVLGAFTTGTLLIRWNVSPWLGMVLGGLIAVLFALLVGYPLFRLGVKEVWYALSSAALVEVMRVAFLIWSQVGGPVERYLPYHEWSLYHLRFATYFPFYYIMLGMLILGLLVNHHPSFPPGILPDGSGRERGSGRGAGGQHSGM